MRIIPMRRRVPAGRMVFALILLGGVWSTPTNAIIIIGSCSISATSVLFGTYDPASTAPRDSAGTVTLSCNIVLGLLEAWDIALSTGGSGSFSPRRLASGVQTLDYNLYTDVARTTVWGDGSGGTNKIAGTVTLAVGSHTVNYTVYGRIPRFQDRPPGVYGDVITVTLNY